MASAAASQIPRLEEAVPDTRVFLFAVIVSAVATLLCGLLPAWKAAEAIPEGLITAGREVTETRRSGRIHRTVVAAEVALGTVLAIGSGLVLISFHRVMNMRTGFESEAVSLVNLSLPPTKYATVEQLNSFLVRANQGVAAIPGVSGVAGSTATPFNAGGRISPAVREGAEDNGTVSYVLVAWPTVSSDYFRTMKIPLRDGRLFRDGESEHVAVLSESAARAVFPGADPIGRRVTTDGTPHQWFRVIGVVGDVLAEGLDRAIAPAIYLPFWQYGRNQFAIAVRSALTPEALSKQVREAVWRVDPEIPVPEVRTMASLISQSAQQRRLQAILLAGLASIAVLLAAVGIYGVVAYSVARRRKEIGLRMALGADSADIRQVVFRHGMAPVLTGLVAGVVAGGGLAKGMSALLFHVSTLNPLAYVAAFLVLGIAGALPCWMTAARAARTDPVVALRTE